MHTSKRAAAGFRNNLPCLDSRRCLAGWKAALAVAFAVGSLAAASPLSAREKDTTPYGEGLIINVPFPEHEVAQVVQDIVQNGIIRGTKEYNKDEYVTGATTESSLKLFPVWTGAGEVFYKVKLRALDPRNFKDGGDMGTLAVRYIVQPQGDKNTVLQINAVFVEDIRRTVHQSNGSVESAEYQDIHEHLEQIAVMKAEGLEIARENEEKRNAKRGAPVSSSSRESSSSNQSSGSAVLPEPASSAQASSQTISQMTPSPPVFSRPTASPAVSISGSADTGTSTSAPAATDVTPERAPTAEAAAAPAPTYTDARSTPQTPQERVKDLRREVERRVKAPGGALRSAPFHTASTLQSLATGTEVLIVITTPYWVGVETHEGQHGWMLRDDLELLP